MFKRLIVMLALGAALVACSPAGTSSDEPSLGTESAMPTDVMPSDAMPSESVAPSP